MTVAERWLYFPMIGVLGMIGAFFGHPERLDSHTLESKDLAKRKKDSSRIYDSLRMTVGTSIIILFFIRSFMRTLDWRTGLSLYSSTISTTSSFDMQNNMGVELFRVGRVSEAKQYFMKSTKLAPYWWVNWNNLGAAYEREGNVQKARECYEKSIQNGQYILAYENYAKILISQERESQKTKEFIQKARTLFPESSILKNIYLYEHY